MFYKFNFNNFDIYYTFKLHNMNIELRFGKPFPYDYDTILDQFSGTKTNSIRTSSIPLVQFWKQTDLRLNELFEVINVTFGKQILCFEYPTKPLEGKGKASMTDLMILCDNVKIAVEAKFTEYAKMNSEPIDKWQKNTDNIPNREKVLAYWTSLIKPFSNGLDTNAIQKISYQFYHRTASACYRTERAIVVYQLFYDKETYKSFKVFKDKLKEYVITINPNEKLDFFIWEVEVIQKLQDNKGTDPFSLMKFQNVYEFLKTDLYKI